MLLADSLAAVWAAWLGRPLPVLELVVSLLFQLLGCMRYMNLLPYRPSKVESRRPRLPMTAGAIKRTMKRTKRVK